jgi:hypothetical protein
MKKGIRVVLLLLLVVIFVCGFNIWSQTSPVAFDYQYIYDRDTEQDLAGAFATALRINHLSAYDMIDPSLKPRLDKWMNSHQSKKCESTPDYFNIEPGTNQGSKSVLNCFGSNGRIRFEVDNIVIKDMKVIDWGEVTEED